MINNIAYDSRDRNLKIMSPTSPSAKRKNIDPSDNNHVQAISNSNNYVSNNNHSLSYYPNSHQNNYNNDHVTERQFNMDKIIKDLNQKILRISQKISQHQNILLRITQASVQNNKEEYKKNLGQNQIKNDFNRSSDVINETIMRLKKDFQDYKEGNIVTKEIQVKNKLFSELIQKSEERMKGEMHSSIKKYMQNSQNSTGMSQNNLLDKYDQIDKLAKKLQKHVMMNTNKINMAFQKIDNISSTVQGHMQIINVQVNKGISKIVTFINEKVSKPVNETITKLSQRLLSLQQKPDNKHFGGLKTSLERSQKNKYKAEYKQSLSIQHEQFIISQKLYYVDIDGYLLDNEYFYLTDKQNEKIRLNEKQIKLLLKQPTFS